jgi:fimbrial chaperone protein
MKWLAACRRGAALLLFVCSMAQAASLQVNPLRVHLPAKRPVSSVEVTNLGATTTDVEVQLHVWKQVNGEDVLEPDNQLVVTPPIFSIEPGSSQVVRIGLLSPSTDSMERAFRMILREIPSGQPLENTESPASLRVLLQMSIPVFCAPNGAIEKGLRLTASRSKNGDISLRAMNHGNVHARFQEVTLLSHTGEKLVRQSLLRYVLPGQDVEVTALKNQGANRIKALYTFPGASGQIEAEVSLDAAQAPEKY